jgi:hypothetical protein
MKKVFVILLATALVAGCKGKKAGGWSKAEKDAFITNCEGSAKASVGEDKAKSYCSCMQAKVEEKYPNAADAGKLDMTTTMEWAQTCMK